MIPVKVKDLIPAFCEREGYTGDTAAVVERLIMYQFEKIKEEQIKMDYEYLKVPYLGYFFAKSWAVKRQLTSLEKSLEYREPLKKNGKPSPTYQALLEYKNHLASVYAKMQERFEINKEIIRKAKEDRHFHDGAEPDIQTSMEQSQPDSGGFI
jgi:hypothetical protein